MVIPDYESLMLPLMQLANDSKDHSNAELIETLAQRFGLTEADRRELVPSGRQTIFANRASWARTYLTKAGLIEHAGRGRFRISQRGIELLRTHPAGINTKFLHNYPEFREFKQRPNQRVGPNGRHRRALNLTNEGDVEAETQTPQEILEGSYQTLRRSLSDELLARVKASPPRFFETLVVDLLVAMGYGGSRKDAGQAIGKSNDEGIDGVIKEDRLGLDVIYVQAKRWDGTVGRPTVQGFAGSLEGQRATKGVFIVTSQFSREAREYVERIEKKIVLIDGEELAQLMIDYGIGVAEEQTYVIKRIDADYFGDE